MRVRARPARRQDLEPAVDVHVAPVVDALED
jgi:hypothetical protein